MDLKNVSWVEKYRPSSLAGVVGNHIPKIQAYLNNPQSIPNFLFSSKTPGTGKTTTAKAIINDLGCDSLVLNASDDRTLEVVRTKIKDFARSKSTTGIKKCCFLDEFDGNLKATQEALRNLMETYSANVFFILTCNNVEKVIDPIQSRCVHIPFTKPEKNDIADRLRFVLKSEKLEYDEDGILSLIDLNYPNIRNCINTIQDLSVENKSITVESLSEQVSDYDTVWYLITDGSYKDTREYIINNNIDCNVLNHRIFDKIMNTSLDIVSQVKLIRIIATIEKDIKLSSDATIIFISNLDDIINIVSGK